MSPWSLRVRVMDRESQPLFGLNPVSNLMGFPVKFTGLKRGSCIGALGSKCLQYLNTWTLSVSFYSTFVVEFGVDFKC